LAAAAIAYALALTFYLKPFLLPLYLVLLRYLVLPRSLREPPQRLRRDMPLWVVLAVITLVYALAVGQFGHMWIERPSAEMWFQFASLVWLRGATPLLLGQWVSSDTGVRAHLTVVAAQLALAALVVVSIWRRPRAWRAWLFWLIVLAVNSAVIGLGRVAQFGPWIAVDIRFQAEIALLLPLTLALAFSSAIGPRRAPAKDEAAFPRMAMWRRCAIPGLAAGLAVFALSCLDSYHRLDDAWDGRKARLYVDNLRKSLDTLQRGGWSPSILDGDAGAALGPILRPQYRPLGRVLPLIDHRVVVGYQRGEPLAFVDDEGDVRLATVTTTMVWKARPGDPCGDWPGTQLPVRDVPTGTARVAIRLEASPAPGQEVDVLVDRGHGFAPESEAILRFGASERTAWMLLGGPDIEDLMLSEPFGARVCLKTARVLAVRPRASS
jgi:hypothetical protein